MMQKLVVTIGVSLVLIISSFNPFIYRQLQDSNYLSPIVKDLQKKWPDNKSINLVFHGHSVPSGYFVTPEVRTLESYPYLLMKKIKQTYPNAQINTIVTARGGENSLSGSARFIEDVLCHKPDVIFIDYALNDRKIGLDSSKNAWESMIKEALSKGIKVMLLTPTPDLNEDISVKKSPLNLHAMMIENLANKYNIGIVDPYNQFKKLSKKQSLEAYMAQKNHINEKGHELVSQLIYEYFNPGNHK